MGFPFITHNPDDDPAPPRGSGESFWVAQSRQRAFMEGNPDAEYLGHLANRARTPVDYQPSNATAHERAFPDGQDWASIRDDELTHEQSKMDQIQARRKVEGRG